MKRVLSGIQPTSESFHLGNYLGAVKQWVDLQNGHETYYSIVDLHALTGDVDPKLLRARTLASAAQLIAVGIDTEKSALFVQSHLPEHNQLDAAFTVVVGAGDSEDQKMLDVCEESMWRGIAAGKKGGKLSDIGHAIEEYVNSQGKYGILREYGGHGIGTSMHMDPHVLNYGRPGHGPDLVEGICLAIEPMITRGSHKTKVLGDDWTVISQDKSRGSHFENSYCIAPDGKPFVLTALDGGKSELGRLGIEISDLL